MKRFFLIILFHREDSTQKIVENFENGLHPKIPINLQASCSLGNKYLNTHLQVLSLKFCHISCRKMKRDQKSATVLLITYIEI